MSTRSTRLDDLIVDRRVSNRLPIARDVRYTVLGAKKCVKQVGSGKTLNMSSHGVLFTTETGLAKGALVEIAVSWPAQLNNVIPLKLVMMGVLVRASVKQAAISIVSYEFKTRGSSL